MVSFGVLVALAVFVFGVPLKGSSPPSPSARSLYVVTTTGFGLLMSAFTRTQIAAIFGTAIVDDRCRPSSSPACIDPVSSLEGVGRVIGQTSP